MKRKLFFLFLLSLFAVQVFALDQKRLQKIDSLRSVLLVESHDTTKIDIYYTIGSSFGYGEYLDSCVSNYQKGLDISQSIRDHDGIAEGLKNIMRAYYYSNILDVAYKYYLKLEKYLQTTGDLDAVKHNYRWLGNIYNSQKRLNDAIYYYRLAINYYESINDSLRIGYTYGNMARAFNTAGLYDSSLYYFRIVHSYYHQYFGSIGNDLISFARNHAFLGNMDSAKYYADYTVRQMALETSKNPNPVAMSNGFGVKADIMLMMNERDSAIKYNHLALKYDSMTNDVLRFSLHYGNLYKIYKEKGDHKSALFYLEAFKEYSDSVRTLEGEAAFLEMEARNNLTIREKELAERRLELKEKDEVIEVKDKRNFRLIILILVVFALLAKVSVDFIKKRKDHRLISEQKVLLEEKNKEVTDSINYARRIQEAILPPNDFVKRVCPDSFILYIPKDIVAGDFYLIEQKENKLVIAAADCTGHGVPGAMVSVACSNALQRALNEVEVSNTGKVLDRTHELVAETFNKRGSSIKDGMDISMVVIDKAVKKAFWSGANNPLWYVTAKGLYEEKPNRQSIGSSDEKQPFSTKVIELKEDGMLYLFSDGYADQFGGEKGKKFMKARFKEELLKIYSTDVSAQKQALLKKFNDWKAEREQIDDVLIIGIKV